MGKRDGWTYAVGTGFLYVISVAKPYPGFRNKTEYSIALCDPEKGTQEIMFKSSPDGEIRVVRPLPSFVDMEDLNRNWSRNAVVQSILESLGYPMAFIAIKVPKEISSALTKIDVPGEMTDKSEMHITLLYLGKNIPIEQVLLATSACFSVSQMCRPFGVSTNTVTAFPENPEDGFPIICPIDSPPIHSFQSALRRALDEAGADYSKKYPEYNPHVTLSYSKYPVVETEFPRVSWTVTEFIIWGGDEGDEKIAITLPLEGGIEEE